LKGNCVEPYSAGIEPQGLNPVAVKVMAEAGVDISNQYSKHLDELKNIKFDYVITVCDSAHESCPVFPGKTKLIHIGFDDPPHMAKQAKSEDEVLNIYRRVRDEIRNFVETLPDSLTDLQQIPGVGERIARHMNDIGIKTVADLKGKDPEKLYRRLCDFKAQPVDRCMLYVFRMAVYFASERNPDPQLLKWWNWKDKQ
jgi:arsenate reductase